jgi:anthranilate synthase component 2
MPTNPTVLVLDNYDSFTYNLVHLLKELHATVIVKRNDQISLSEVNEYHKILLSPGPGVPSEAGIMPDLIKQYAATKSIFGVCLGHQAIGESFGCQLLNMPDVYHGVAHKIHVVKPDVLFQNIPSNFLACRYHSWTVLYPPKNSDIEVTAEDDEGNIMALRHKKFDVRGVQFHPESILTENGKAMVENWLKS